MSDAINESERLSRHAKQHEEYREIEELNNDAQELVDLVKTKEKVIEELKNSLVEARNCVSAMEEEIRSKRANKAEAVDEERGEHTTHWVSTHNLDNIHEWYTKVLARPARCPHSTIRDFVAIAKLKIVEGSTSMSPANTLVQSSSWSWYVTDICNGIYQC